ncbi:hypothetical protein GCK72_018651 [Caenorhabditis remanei]|uniref:Uncharacterized protein n=1 Tax=Caenorhabditis remanei TaxID=31234 RepID=A0A6A5GAC4_CAERE|nr:hypothetical protein GCK72_018651 [Caenorhabditis remanei]KAF1752097.1 hypothetical protein GCK72_018651 [Caenorhabditis remanei]
MDNNQRSVPSSPAPGHGSSGYYSQQDTLHHDERTTPPTAFHFPQTHQAQPAPVMGQPPGYPMQAHVLVDPVTGQHYIVPQYYPPPMYPYPAAPQPHHPAAPMYYPYGPAPSHAPVPAQNVAPPPTTSAPSNSANPINYMGLPMYNPPASSHEKKDDSEDTMSTTSNISRSSFSLMQNQKTPVSQQQQQQQFGRENSREYMYLHRSPTTNPAPPSPLMRPKLFHQRLDTVADPRGGTQSDFEGKAPLMRQKTNDHPTSSASDHESTKRFSRTSFGTPATVQTEEFVRVPNPNPPAKSVRMEINFADVPSMPSEPKPAKKSNATAFTVNLGEEKEVSLQEAARTLAENRRKVKLAKSTSHDRTPSTPEALAASKTNKNYLLERLLTGKTGTPTENSNEEIEVSPETPEEHRDFDARSEALTFVIDTSRRNNAGGYGGQTHFQQQRVVQYSDEEDDSDSDSEFMEQYSNTQQSKTSQPLQTIPPPSQPQQTHHSPVQMPLSSPRPSALPAPGFSRQTSTASTLTTQAPPPALPSPRTPSTSASSTPRTSSRFDRSNGGSSDFLQELAKLRMMAGLPAAGPTSSEAEQKAMMMAHQRPTTTFRRSEVSSSARAPTVSSSQKTIGLGERGGSRASFTGKTKETNTTPTPSRRSENRRSLTGNSSPQLSNLARPPFRTGAPRGIMIGQSEQQREQEMTAWLRRKDYNPMKAAAAGKKPSNEVSREQQFQSRRSMTFHNTDEVTSPFGRAASGMVPIRPPPRNRSQEPRDINNEKYRSVQKDQRLKRTVDMLSQKCKKSIELIRIQNKGCLSVSVEDLLSAAAEEPRPRETLDEQLDRLSDAFDAVQRYLEQYSLDGYHSPTSDDRYFDDDMMESKSTFSGVSTHQERNNVPSTESLTSSYRKKILDS